MLDYEKSLYAKGYNLIVGCDEAGRGPLCGPVVCAACILPPNYKNEEINKKANSEFVNGINSRVQSLESSTQASNIVTIVRNSTEYKNDLNNKVNTSDFNSYKSTISDSFKTVNEDIKAKSHNEELRKIIEERKEKELAARKAMKENSEKEKQKSSIRNERIIPSRGADRSR